jgi:hypothetical protein
MQLQFRDVNDTVKAIDKLDFAYTVSPYRRRVNIQPRFGKSGGVVSGDEQVDARDISLKMNVASESSVTYLNNINSLVGFFLPDNGPFYMEDTDRNLRTEVRYLSYADNSPETGTQNKVSASNKLDLKMLDSHWEDQDAIIVSSPSGGIANGETLVINNDGPVDCYPIINVRALSNNSDFSIVSDELGISCRLGSNSFVIGCEFTIDCINGTIFLNDGISDVESSASLFSGTGFLRIKTGENTFRYESEFGDCEIDISYRRRFPF